MKKAITVFEDTTMAYNRWVQGIASGEHSAEQLPLTKAIEGDFKRLHPNHSKTRRPLHPILDKSPEALGSAIIHLSNLKQMTKTALNSNLVHRGTNKQTLNRILYRLNRMSLLVQLTVKDFNRIS